MNIKQLSLLNYKNFESLDLEFSPAMNCLAGANGIGKTTVLDAIYHLSYGKGYFNPLSTQNIRHGEELFLVEGNFEKEGQSEKISCGFKKGAKKVLKRNGKIYDRITQHIGLLPVVMISPADRDLIAEGSDVRRKFIDGNVSQADSAYLESLLAYQRILSQRNALLKFFAANHTFDEENLQIYDEQLHQFGSELYEKRKRFLEEFTPLFLKHYRVISGEKENISLEYQSGMHKNPLRELLLENRAKDRTLQYTSVGLHKDDLRFEIEGYPIKKFGSQGQQKSFLIALKLAQFQFLKRHSGTTPILLLDDVFDKLDEQRVAQLVELVKGDDYEQIFITDTHPERTEKMLQASGEEYKMLTL
jgi:DNA replication and repair protein RecF